MKSAYAAAAAVLIASTGAAAPANAVGICSIFNPAACSAPPAAAQQPSAEQATAPTPSSEDPLQLHPKKSGRHTASRSTHHRHARTASTHRSHTQGAPEPEKAADTAAPATQAPASMQPKPVPTVAVAAPSAAVAPSQQTEGFAASHQPWSGASAFASPTMGMGTTWPPPAPTPSQPKISPKAVASGPAGVKVVSSDAVNEIDLAADASGPGQAHAESTDRGVSLVSQAKADEARSQSEQPQVAESWSGWLYRICADGLSAAASAVRAVLM